MDYGWDEKGVCRKLRTMDEKEQRQSLRSLLTQRHLAGHVYACRSRAKGKVRGVYRISLQKRSDVRSAKHGNNKKILVV